MTDPGHPYSALPSYTGTLTPEHLAVIHAERDRWLQIGLSTTRVDRPAAEAAVRRAYTAAGLQPPDIVVWMDSPLGGCLATATIRQLHDQPGRPLSDRLRRQLEDQLGHDLLQRRGQLRDELSNRLVGQLREQRWNQRDAQLWTSPAASAGISSTGSCGASSTASFDQFGHQLDLLEEQLVDQLVPLGEQLGEHLGDQLYNQLQEQLGEHLGDQLDLLEEQLDQWDEPPWIAKYRCALRVAGLESSPRLEAFADAVASLGMWWVQRGAVILTDQPTTIARDDHGRLHSETGPALAWADGHSLHAIHGVRVPREVVEAPETITVDQVRDERNQEVRRVMLDRYGHQRYLRDAGAERVHTDDAGTLWRCPLPGDEPLVMVEVTNATPDPEGRMSRPAGGRMSMPRRGRTRRAVPAGAPAAARRSLRNRGAPRSPRPAAGRCAVFGTACSDAGSRRSPHRPRRRRPRRPRRRSPRRPRRRSPRRPRRRSPRRRRCAHRRRSSRTSRPWKQGCRTPGSTLAQAVRYGGTSNTPTRLCWTSPLR
jgi:hypothetical protein